MTDSMFLHEKCGEKREVFLERAISFSLRIDDFYDRETFLEYIVGNDLEIFDDLNGWPEFMDGAEEPKEVAQ